MDIEVRHQAEARLDEKYSSWRKVIQDTFYFSRKVVLEPLQGGWSGADVLRAHVRQRTDDGGGEGEWVWKVSSSPWKLHREVQAHLRMIRGGLDFARSVPLLWRGVVVENGVASIAYQFAKGTRQASELLQETNGPKKLCEQITPMLKGFYCDTVKETGVVGKILSNWCPKEDNLVQAAEQIPDTKFAGILRDLAEEKDNDSLGQARTYQQCLIHGDLHLGNIMIGEPCVFIDFALSDVGPVAVDIAKFSRSQMA